MHFDMWWQCLHGVSAWPQAISPDMEGDRTNSHQHLFSASCDEILSASNGGPCRVGERERECEGRSELGERRKLREREKEMKGEGDRERGRE